MSDTDIYKNREAMPVGNKPPHKRRRRRKKTQRAFDDHDRKRRSKNSGLRRLLHLSRKSENEKVIWISAGVLFAVVLIVIAIWQFVIKEQLVREQETADQYIEYQPNIPETQKQND
ncbi:hypothetical protein P4B35_16030 [Pontiellaceae bacterium B12227]|nr:hypothetical protein [Pontiellaceae bacterium B12227]